MLRHTHILVLLLFTTIAFTPHAVANHAGGAFNGHQPVQIFIDDDLFIVVPGPPTDGSAPPTPAPPPPPSTPLMEVPFHAKYIKDFFGTHIIRDTPSQVCSGFFLEHKRDRIGSWEPFGGNDTLGRIGYRRNPPSDPTPAPGCGLPDCVFTGFHLVTNEVATCTFTDSSGQIRQERWAIIVYAGEIKHINGELWGIVPLRSDTFPHVAWNVITPANKPLSQTASNTLPYIVSQTFEEVQAFGDYDPPTNGTSIDFNTPRVRYSHKPDNLTQIYITGFRTSGVISEDANDWWTVVDYINGKGGGTRTMMAIQNFAAQTRAQFPDRKFEIIGHSLGCAEATALYYDKAFRARDTVHCLSPPLGIPSHLMRQYAGYATYIGYGGKYDSVNGREFGNQVRRSEGVNIKDVETGILDLNVHDRCKYMEQIFGQCLF